MMKITIIVICCCGLILLITGKGVAQAHTTAMPVIIEKDGRHAFLVDGKPFFMLGGQVHNSSGWPGMMPEVWQAVGVMHLNTLEVPIYWEQIEAQPGKFDFSMVDTLITQARKHKIHLVLLWFATWKNGSNHYIPEWMKQDAAKYPNITSKNGQPVDSPSPNVDATLAADIDAFKGVMRHLKQADPQHTVIMVQVENEAGAWGSVRDYSPFAQKLFEGQVPALLLNPKILAALNAPVVAGGTWAQVFGDRADEYFQAWSVARFIGQVATAGKAEYPLPMYVNCALRDPLTNPTANNYESGGPTDNVVPIWKAAAPVIDLLAPDIYLEGSNKVLKVIDLYCRPDNALFVPEIALTANNAKYMYEVIARGGIGFSPFGIDDNRHGSTLSELTKCLKPFGQEYDVLEPMMRELARWGFEGKIKAVVEHEDHAEQIINFDAWQVVVSFDFEHRDDVKTNAEDNGKVMVVQLDDNKFLVTGTMNHITFKVAGPNTGKAWQYLKVEEGHYENGTFKVLRILNADETDWGGPRFGTMPTVFRISVIAR